MSNTRKTLNKWLKIRFGKLTVEPHYQKNKPLIIAEELLINDNKYSSSLVDYKVFCISGSLHPILVCSNRSTGKKDVAFYDKTWTLLPEMLNKQHYSIVNEICKPYTLETMLSTATIFSHEHPFVRVDFYEVGRKLYFGEMTFTPMGGYQSTISPEMILQMGQLLKL